MKFYNVFSGFLSGETREAYLRALGDRKFNSLHSYWYLKGLDDNKIKEGFAITKGDIMIDSGAFTAWTKDITIRTSEYIKWINKWDDYVTTFGQIDCIPPKGAKLDVLNKCCQQSWDNYIVMTEGGIVKEPKRDAKGRDIIDPETGEVVLEDITVPPVKSPEKILYTFHFGEPYEWLRKILNHKLPDGRPVEYMAFGGLVGRSKSERDNFLTICFDIISESSNPNIKVHGFGVSTKAMWQKFPFTSCDSFSPGMHANHGSTWNEEGKQEKYVENMDELCKPRTVEQIDSTIFEDVTFQEYYNPEEGKTEDVLTEEAKQRCQNKADLLVKNIEFWNNEAEKIIPFKWVKKEKGLLNISF